MAVMYPYFVYSQARHRSSAVEEFREGDRKYLLFGLCHCVRTTLVLNVVTVLLCLVSVAFTAAGIAIQDSHEYMNNRHINIEYASHQAKFRLFYHVTLALLLAGSCVHLVAVVACIFGVRYVVPGLVVPELIVAGLLVGLVLFATIATVICMIIILGFLWPLTAATAAIVLYSSFYFYSLIVTYRYIVAKRHSWSCGRHRAA